MYLGLQLRLGLPKSCVFIFFPFLISFSWKFCTRPHFQHLWVHGKIKREGCAKVVGFFFFRKAFLPEKRAKAAYSCFSPFSIPSTENFACALIFNSCERMEKSSAKDAQKWLEKTSFSESLFTRKCAIKQLAKFHMTGENFKSWSSMLAMRFCVVRRLTFCFGLMGCSAMQQFTLDSNNIL